MGDAGRDGRLTSSTSRGPGRLLVAVYAILALSATGRSVVQLATKLSEAPVAYILSAVAALIYVVATVALATRRSWSRPLAWGAIGTELAGVLVVGGLSLADRSLFPDATVWSGFGAGYGYVPLVLPFVGLWWLWRTRSTGVSTRHAAH